MLSKRTGTVSRARILRRTMTPLEVRLWQVLRERPAGLKFRRQHPLGPFVLDFFCREAGLAIEIDGESHDRGDHPARDAARDAILRTAGTMTLRVPARLVFDDLDAVTRHVVAVASARVPLHHPAAPGGPPPRDKLGED